MKRMLLATMFIVCGLTCLSLTADEARTAYVIQPGEETLVVTDMPTFTVSEPITNSFLSINGEYIEPPYVVSVSNLAIVSNGIMVQNDELQVYKREWYSGRVGVTPETIGKWC
ncbi:MAG: hypothetical protein FWH21_01635 [Kiritimatiellaeota bacterium]|nr:hypothetical protein [Kiritimatiellota bacterium]